MKNKGQMEIFGLAIIVILIVVGLLFFARFVLMKEPAGRRAEYIYSELSSNMINAYLSTTSADCSGISMSDLLQDCASGTGIICDSGLDSCSYAGNAAEMILNMTLSEWKYSYYFSVTANEKDIISPIGKKCLGDKNSKDYPLPLGGGASMDVRLEICR